MSYLPGGIAAVTYIHFRILDRHAPAIALQFFRTGALTVLVPHLDPAQRADVRAERLQTAKAKAENLSTERPFSTQSWNRSSFVGASVQHRSTIRTLRTGSTMVRLSRSYLRPWAH
jgi:hypothetical protein